MDKEPISCPICSGKPLEYSIDSINLHFLNDRLKDKKINATISLARIVWNNIPQLRLTADSKTVIEGLSEAMCESLQKEVNDVLRPIEVFTQTFPTLIQKFPADIKKDLQREFEETKSKLEEEFRLLRESAPTFANVTEAIQTVTETIETVTQKEMDEFKKGLIDKFKQTLEEMGFPEPEQMRLLAQLVPSVLPLLQDLLRTQKVPKEKGERGELELWDELNDYYPEDEYDRLGVSGDTDILTKPRYNGMDLGWKVLIESKKNNSGWSRSYIQQVQRHMNARGEHFAILAVEVMPKGANGFLIQPCSEGAILVTSRDNFKVCYGALRAVLASLHPFNSRSIDLKKLFTDKRIEEAIKDAYQYQAYVKNIRNKVLNIVTNAKGITQNVDDLDNCLKQCLRELQHKISEAVREAEGTSPTPQLGFSEREL